MLDSFSDEDHKKFEKAVENGELKITIRIIFENDYINFNKTTFTFLDDVVSFHEVLEGRNIHRGGEGD